MSMSENDVYPKSTENDHNDCMATDWGKYVPYFQTNPHFA